MLRAEGLSDDTYGEAKRFFELTDWQLHKIVCGSGTTVRADTAAQWIRDTAQPRPGLFSMLWDALYIFQ
ncbi:succinate dehydrogenase flavin-adding protein (antitoxin of CptAB toxin-antitoxin module) [Sinorhizobium kostiense]|uniref:Succinate dehydrogenase flavin-adding protein (Antitoxin of CptAB toxin-antitoxin module) n=1 Tax=Sinorhizobium kostiense TaxID=76747 RepID=A0ABS4R7D3_9HYPH|nr:succinate dehydrogenase flavin-adding protein (antitoxin of CptAB toxin-antitoxin module) [Sinorhizobium kostiense]